MQLENARKRNMRQVARDKAAGLLGGAPDLVIACRSRIIFCEMKSEKGSVRPDQIEVHRILGAMGHVVIVCYGFEDAKRQLTELLGPARSYADDSTPDPEPFI
jgi:hypothetical protein